MHKPNEISIIIWSLQPTILYYQVKTLFDVTERCCSLELNLILSEITQNIFLANQERKLQNLNKENWNIPYLIVFKDKEEKNKCPKLICLRNCYFLKLFFRRVAIGLQRILLEKNYWSSKLTVKKNGTKLVAENFQADE